MVGVLQYPDSQGPAGSIEFRSGLKNCDEYGLHRIFGFSWIAQDLHGHAHHESLIAVEYYCQGVVVAFRKAGHDEFIGQSRQSRVARRLEWAQHLIRDVYGLYVSTLSP